MSLRRRVALLAVPLAIVTACTSSAGDEGGSGVAPGMPTDAPGLGRLMTSATKQISSAHVELEITLAGQEITGGGDEKLRNGELVAMDLTETLPGGQGDIRVILVDGTTYAKLPPSMNSSSTPWLIVSDESSNQIVRQLAASLDSALASASLATVSTFTRAAKSIEGKGTESIGGVETTHYEIVVDVAKLPDSMPGKSDLEDGGVEEIPIDLYVDSDGRPIRLVEELTLQGQDIATTATISEFNKPVSIKAPPANQVGD